MGKRTYLWSAFTGTTVFGPVLWLCNELFGWQVGKWLDAAERGEGPFHALASWGLAMLISYQDIFTGISIGIGFSLVVTYWPLIRAKTKRARRWVSLFFRLVYLSLTGDMRTSTGATVIAANNSSTWIPLDGKVLERKARVLCEPVEVAYGIIMSSRVYFHRKSEDTSRELKVSYEVWGPLSLFGAIRKYKRMNYFDLLDFLESGNNKKRQGGNNA